MIESFRHRGLKRFYSKDESGQIGAALLPRVKRVLSLLDAAPTEQALNLPGFRLHALKGDLKGFWSVTVSGNWRIVFRFEDGKAKDVDLIDYH